MKWEYFGTGLALIGIGITLLVALPPPWWPRMPPALVHIGVVVGAILVVIGIILAVFGSWPTVPQPKLPFLGMGVGAIILLVSALWFFVFPDVMTDRSSDETDQPAAPDVTLRLVYPTNPALLLVNDSNVLAREIKWSVGLWNIDALGQPPQPLPIPVGTFDWIRPHARGGPQDLFGRFASSLKTGDRIVGSVSVICPDCARGHSYLVYIEWGKSGWFMEGSDEKSGTIFVPKTGLPADITNFAETIQAIPEAQRIPIAAP